MIYTAIFEALINEIKQDGRYRTFIELERIAGQFPTALWRTPEGPRSVTVWCSNDYLGMGQHPDVLAAMHQTLDASGAGTGEHGISRDQFASMSSWKQHLLILITRTSPALYLGLDFQSGRAGNSG